MNTFTFGRFRFCLWFAILMFSTHANAQTIVRASDGGEHRAQVAVGTGFDDSLAPLAVSGTWFAPWFGRTVYVGGELTVPMAQPDLRDHRIEVLGEFPVFDRRWDAWLGLGVREVSTANDAYRGTAVGTVITATAGYFGDRTTLAVEGSYWHAWMGCISTTEFAIEPGGATGYRGCAFSTARTPRIGLRAGMLVGDFEISLRGGYEWRGEYNLAVPPLYLRLGIGYRF